MTTAAIIIAENRLVIFMLRLSTEDVSRYECTSVRRINKELLRLFCAEPVGSLYNSRLSQLDISFMDIARDLTAHIIADQFADGGGEVKIDRVDIFCNEAILQCPVGGLP